MQAIGVFEAGPPENLRLVDLESPVPGPTEVVVRQNYAGVNYGDVIRRKRGLFRPDRRPPYVLGFEGCGVITEVGSDVRRVRRGDRITYLIESDAYAELVVVPEQNCFAVPAGIADAEAAAIMCTGLTALELFSQADLRRGQIALVHGASGGVGTLLLQLLKRHEIETIAVVGSSAKASFAHDLGADHVVVSDIQNFADVVSSVTHGNGVNAIFDCVGHAALEGNISSAARDARWFYFGSTSGHPNFPGDKVLMKSLQIRGFVVFDLLRQPERLEAIVKKLFEARLDGTIRISIQEIIDKADAARAHELLEQRRVSGKLVLRFAN